MSTASASSSTCALAEQVYPLTLFDEMYAEVGVAMAWIVEGRIDTARITRALDRIITRWPMLAGRIERGTNKRMQLRIPLLKQSAMYPTSYMPYAITSINSPKPLSDYVPVPLPVAHNRLPVSLMQAPDTPQTTGQWINRCLPLTYWHVTHFAQETDGAEYSTIGVTFPHAVFDGLGIARVIHTLEAELLGRTWDPPPLSVNEDGANALEALLTNVMAKQDEGLRTSSKESYAGFVVGLWFNIVFFSWHLWQTFWSNVQCRTIIVPERAYTHLRDRIRMEAALTDKDQTSITTADVISAFTFKTIFADVPPHKLLQFSSLASVRRFSEAIATYPHNCVLSLPYPLFSSSHVQSLSLADFAAELALYRHKFTLDNAADLYRLMQSAWHLPGFARVSPCDPCADEILMISNVTIARIVDVDWTGAGPGVGKTICRYKTVLAGVPVKFTSVVTVAGKLPDGSLVLDLVLSKKRMDAFEARVRELIAEAEEC